MKNFLTKPIIITIAALLVVGSVVGIYRIGTPTAIAANSYDNSAAYNAGQFGSPWSLSYVTGSCANRLMIATLIDQQTLATDIVSVKYAGVSLTLATSTPTTFGYNQGDYYLIAPSTGTNNLVITTNSGSSFFYGHFYVATYCGVSQTGFPDAVQTFAHSPMSGTTLTESLTTVASNSWIFISIADASGGLPGAGTGSTLRQHAVPANGGDTLGGILDTNGPVSPGSNSMTTSGYSNDYMSDIMISFAPAGGGGGTTPAPAFIQFDFIDTKHVV